MILKITYILSLLFHIGAFEAQEIPDQYKVDWSKSGITPTIYSANQVDFKFQQTKNPDLSNNDLIDKLIKSFEKEGGIIFFEAGSYQFSRTIKLRSNISLIGTHRDSVKLIFDNNRKGDLISLSGRLGDKIKPLSDLLLHKNTVNLENSTLKVGDIIYVADDDTELVNDYWATGCTGQLFRIIQIIDSQVTLSNKARRPFVLSNKMTVRKINPIQYCYVTNLSITRSDHTTIHSSNIFMNYAFNCSVTNVSSYKCSYSHIALEKSLNCGVKDCSFSESINFGKGGNGYGVVLQFGTSDCKIENNCFCTLRHSMLAQCGANGNVFINNISKNPFWTGTMLPPHSSGDIVLHGNYPYANLFKNNTCQHIVIDNSHGKNGPNNCFSENSIESYGIHMNKNAGDEMLFIKNKINKKAIFKGRYKIQGVNHFESENLRKGKNL